MFSGCGQEPVPVLLGVLSSTFAIFRGRHHEFVGFLNSVWFGSTKFVCETLQNPPEDTIFPWEIAHRGRQKMGSATNEVRTRSLCKPRWTRIMALFPGKCDRKDCSPRLADPLNSQFFGFSAISAPSCSNLISSRGVCPAENRILNRRTQRAQRISVPYCLLWKR